MIATLDQRTTAYDPFGEPMDVSRACAETQAGGVVGRYRETRRAALAFWVLALLLVGGRVYLSDQAPSHAALVEAAPAAVQLTSLR